MQKSPVTRMVIENVRRIIPFSSMANPCHRVPAARKKSICILHSVRRKEIALVVDRAWRSACTIPGSAEKSLRSAFVTGLIATTTLNVKHTWRFFYPYRPAGIINDTRYTQTIFFKILRCFIFEMLFLTYWLCYTMRRWKITCFTVFAVLWLARRE